MVIFESEFGKTTLFSAKITFYSLLLATKKVLVRNCGCSQMVLTLICEVNTFYETINICLLKISHVGSPGKKL